MLRPPEEALLALTAHRRKDHRKPGIVIGQMPETPVLVIGKAARQEPDDVSLRDTGMRPEQRMKTDQKRWIFCAPNITSRGCKNRTCEELVPNCVGQLSTSGAACERGWLRTRGGTESKAA